YEPEGIFDCGFSTFRPYRSKIENQKSKILWLSGYRTARLRGRFTMNRMVIRCALRILNPRDAGWPRALSACLFVSLAGLTGSRLPVLADAFTGKVDSFLARKM